MDALFLMLLNFGDFLILLFKVLPPVLTILFTSWKTYAVIFLFIGLGIVDMLANYFLVYRYDDNNFW